MISPRYPDDRISVPFFFNPALDKRLPLIELPAELAAEARGVTQDPANPIHALYGENALKSRLRAHPDVAEIHHADLRRGAGRGIRLTRAFRPRVAPLNDRARPPVVERAKPGRSARRTTKAAPHLGRPSKKCDCTLGRA